MQVTIIDAGDLKRLNRDLRDVADGKELRKELTREFRQVLNPIRAQVQAAYRAQPAGMVPASRQRAAQPDLRTLLAKATRTEVRTSGRQAGARLRVDGRRMPSGMRSLPAYWEGYKRPWRAPLFGNRGRWYVHRARPLFDRITEPHADDARRAVEQAMNRIRGKLERG